MVRIIQLFKTIVPIRLWNTFRSWVFNTKRYLTSDYSQSGETGIIRELLKKSKGVAGFFIEIGANDGITVSNTFGLIKKG